eukprot:scaffold4518_cov410-Prasinococcus_capsulatus_cf.AAC.26
MVGSALHGSGAALTRGWEWHKGNIIFGGAAVVARECSRTCEPGAASAPTGGMRPLPFCVTVPARGSLRCAPSSAGGSGRVQRALWGSTDGMCGR